MKKPFSFFLILILFFVCSCKDKSGDSQQSYLDPKVVFNLKDTLKGVELPEQLWAADISGFRYSDEGLVFVTKLDSFVFQLIDPISGKRISQTGRLGRGPGEFISPMFPDLDRETQTIYIYDLHRQELVPFSYKGGNLVQGEPVDFLDVSKHTYYSKAGERLWVVLDASRNNDHLRLIDTERGIIDSIPNIALPYDNMDISNRRFYSILKASPDKKRFILYEGDLPVVRIYTIKGEKLVLDRRIEYFKDNYEVTKNWYIQDIKKQSPAVYIVPNDDYIYMSVPGKSTKEHRETATYKNYPDNIYIFVYDMKGNFKKSILFDRFFWYYTVSWDNKHLFAIDEDYNIVKYELPKF